MVVECRGGVCPVDMKAHKRQLEGSVSVSSWLWPTRKLEMAGVLWPMVSDPFLKHQGCSRSPKTLSPPAFGFLEDMHVSNPKHAVPTW